MGNFDEIETSLRNSRLRSKFRATGGANLQILASNGSGGELWRGGLGWHRRYISIKLVPLQPIKSRPQLLKIATLSVVLCASVVGRNICLRYLPVSFNQAVGATTPFFTAMFAYLMTFKREAWVTYGALVPVATREMPTDHQASISIASKQAL
ncbi:hypothetical protein COLO4_03677 [Corchorus olitorius]|uniref:Sugar phosphate transporter domain-containing protein n=1 Tax=Corchorus olitorius TaxID=93759 RepID=A0A1R3KXH8_9ROSI|nr:hypothetical protein COLO4_03677 [Corchorus olitorius]